MFSLHATWNTINWNNKKNNNTEISGLTAVDICFRCYWRMNSQKAWLAFIFISAQPCNILY